MKKTLAGLLLIFSSLSLADNANEIIGLIDGFSNKAGVGFDSSYPDLKNQCQVSNTSALRSESWAKLKVGSSSMSDQIKYWGDDGGDYWNPKKTSTKKVTPEGILYTNSFKSNGGEVITFRMFFEQNKITFSTGAHYMSCEFLTK